MGDFVSLPGLKRYIIFLNISFLSLACVFLCIHLSSTELPVLGSYQSFNVSGKNTCKEFLSLDGYQAKCFYLKSSSPCLSEGYINYLQLFYCNFQRFPFLGHSLLFLWLLVLFYLLGNTASEYFCSSLENLSRLLKLSPTIAGVTLLSLGNGATDVFSSLVSFMGSGTGEIGFNTVLGGASFITCVVVGIINISVKQQQIAVNKVALVRDVCFCLLVIASLTVIFLHGQINLWGAIGFWLMYVVYVIVVYISHIYCVNGGKDGEIDANSSCGSDLSVPILSSTEKGEVGLLEEGHLDGRTEAPVKQCFCLWLSVPCKMLLCILEMPLYLPRRLTIPVVCEKKWSKPIAVASVTLAPLLLSALWDLEDHNATFYTKLLVYGIGFLFGIAFGILAYMTTERLSPPKRCLFPWLAGGFLMSVTWSYLIAQELVALLVSLGYIFGISPSILGLTVLAWGNSLGDLITDLTMALYGGPEGAQVAISGCYAGPIFNILFGLGLSLVSSSWHAYPASIVVPRDPHLLETLGFLAGGLIWVLVVLPWRSMRLDGVVGGGLFFIYLLSVSLRLIQSTHSYS